MTFHARRPLKSSGSGLKDGAGVRGKARQEVRETFLNLQSEEVRHGFFELHTLPETNSSPLKISHPKRNGVFQPSIFGCKLAVSFKGGVTPGGQKHLRYDPELEPPWLGWRPGFFGVGEKNGIPTDSETSSPSLWAGEVPKKHVHSHKIHQVEYKEKEAQGHSEGFAFAVTSGDSSNLTTSIPSATDDVVDFLKLRRDDRQQKDLQNKRSTVKTRKTRTI